MTSSLAVLIWASCTICGEPCLCMALPRLVTAFLLRHRLRFSPWEKAPSRPARLCGNQSLSSSICLCNASRANLQQQVLMPPEPCPGRGGRARPQARGSPSTRGSPARVTLLQSVDACPSHLAGKSLSKTVMPSLPAVSPSPSTSSARRAGIGRTSLRQGMGDALTWWNCTCLERTTSRSCRQAPP